MLNIVSFSGGKDSTAMLLRMMEEKMPIDHIVFVDTGMEFPKMYEHIDAVERYIGRPITRLKAEHSFEYYMYEKPITGKYSKKRITNGIRLNGYGWSRVYNRWCTIRLKQIIIKRYISSLGGDYRSYIGLAHDEQHRLLRKGAKNPHNVYPLNEWQMTEADCLAYCKERGFDFCGLYDKFNRVSCWCCPLASLDYFRALRTHFPDLWKRLGEMDKKAASFGHNKFRDVGVEYLDARFALEEEFAKQGKSIRNRAFFKELKERTLK